MNVGPRATEVAAGPTVDRSGVPVEDTAHRRYVRPADGGPDPSACAANGWEPGLHLPPGGRQTPTELVAQGTTLPLPRPVPRRRQVRDRDVQCDEVVGGDHLVDLPGAVATGRAFAATQSHWLRLADGLVIEHRANRDDLGMGLQLGWLAAPGS
jgi:hypothetical protein